MIHSSIKVGAVLVFASLAGLGQVLAVSPPPLDPAALFIPIQDEENKELWQDLRPDVTPPEAAVGNEDHRNWEKATNQTDCERAVGRWDVPTNRCLEKR
jgi:hypothetical protein